MWRDRGTGARRGVRRGIERRRRFLYNQGLTGLTRTCAEERSVLLDNAATRTPSGSPPPSGFPPRERCLRAILAPIHAEVTNPLRLIRPILALLCLFLLLAPAALAAPFTPAPEEYWIKIDKTRLRLYLIKGEDTLVKSYPEAIGRGKGSVKKDRLDLITPEGVFKVRRILQDASQLVYDPAWFNEPGNPRRGSTAASSSPSTTPGRSPSTAPTAPVPWGVGPPTAASASRTGTSTPW